MRIGISCRFYFNVVKNKQVLLSLQAFRISTEYETNMFVKMSRFMIKWACEFHIAFDEKIIIV